MHGLFAALIGDANIMGWGSKAIEIRAVDTGHLDGVFMHKRAQKLRFLCERNDKVCCVCVCLHACVLIVYNICVIYLFSVLSRYSLPPFVHHQILRCTSWL